MMLRSLLVVGALAAQACRGTSASEMNLGEATSVAMQRGIAAAALAVMPWPCAASDERSPAPSDIVLQGWSIVDSALQPIAASTTFDLAFIADAGGAHPATIEQLRRTAKTFTASGAEVVVSLGGMGSETEEIEATLRALSTSAPYIVLAMPGDLEPVIAHREAIERLQRDGLRVLDGSRVRWIRLGIATLTTLPGTRYQGQLAAGAEGCGFDDPAIEQTLEVLAASTGHKVLASWASPRLGATTIAMGDLPLRQSLERHQIGLAVVGEPTKFETLERAEAGYGSHLQILFSGFSDAEPRAPNAGRVLHPSAMIVRFTRSKWSMQRFDLSMQPAP
jgi:hypothetical protein